MFRIVLLLMIFSFILGILVIPVTYGQENQQIKFQKFIADTLLIELDSSSIKHSPPLDLNIIDNRPNPGSVIGIDQVKRMMYVPVDRYLKLDKNLDQTIKQNWNLDTTTSNLFLSIDKINLWYDSDLFYRKNMVLNGYSRLIDDQGNTFKEWQWEFRKKFKKKKVAKITGDILNQWMNSQYAELKEDIPLVPIEAHPYKRQCRIWTDNIFLKDGFIIDARMSLNYPVDQLNSYYRSFPSLYYRKSSKHESIAMGGRDLHWHIRINSFLLFRINGTFRLGFNNFEKSKFKHVEFRNILLVNTGSSAVIEYRPPFHKWLYGGIGIHQSYNFLPEVIEQMETGFVLTVGVILP